MESLPRVLAASNSTAWFRGTLILGTAVRWTVRSFLPSASYRYSVVCPAENWMRRGMPAISLQYSIVVNAVNSMYTSRLIVSPCKGMSFISFYKMIEQGSGSMSPPLFTLEFPISLFCELWIIVEMHHYFFNLPLKSLENLTLWASGKVLV